MLCSFATALLADNTFEGVVSATSTRAGTEPVHFVFTRKGSQLRIENTTNKLEPINIVDLESKRLTIIYPHNSTFVNVDLTKKQAQASAPGLPAGVPLPPAVPPEGFSSAHIGPHVATTRSPPSG